MSDLALHVLALAGAHKLDGPVLVEEMHTDATAVADVMAPLEPDGGQPSERESVWRGALWALVDAPLTALVGTAVPTLGSGIRGSPP